MIGGFYCLLLLDKFTTRVDIYSLCSETALTWKWGQFFDMVCYASSLSRITSSLSFQQEKQLFWMMGRNIFIKFKKITSVLLIFLKFRRNIYIGQQKNNWIELIPLTYEPELIWTVRAPVLSTVSFCMLPLLLPHLQPMFLFSGRWEQQASRLFGQVCGMQNIFRLRKESF